MVDLGVSNNKFCCHDVNDPSRVSNKESIFISFIDVAPQKDAVVQRSHFLHIACGCEIYRGTAF